MSLYWTGEDDWSSLLAELNHLTPQTLNTNSGMLVFLLRCSVSMSVSVVVGPFHCQLVAVGSFYCQLVKFVELYVVGPC